jgi:SAM-dependent methyltransferase
MKTFLHVGCGPLNKSNCYGFDNDNWQEIRFDIDENVNPDIVGTLTDMNSVDSKSVDAIYSSHTIEHIFPHQVSIAVKEFYRVLKDDGIAVITCPDLQRVGQALSNDKLYEPIYQSPMGPVTAFDVIFGHRKTTKDGNQFMIHKGGFTYSTLDRAFFDGGFEARCGGRGAICGLWLVAFKRKRPENEIKEIALSFIPGFDS